MQTMQKATVCSMKEKKEDFHSSLLESDTWDFVTLQQHHKAINHGAFLKTKQGSSQMYDADHNETS